MKVLSSLLLVISLSCFLFLVSAEDFKDFENAFEADEFDSETVPRAAQSLEQPAKASTDQDSSPTEEQEEEDQEEDEQEEEEEEDEPYFDEEEFIGINPDHIPKPIKKQPKSKPQEKQEQKDQPQQPKQIKAWHERDWTTEIIFLNFVTAYFINFFIGKSNNSRLANAWFQRYLPLFKVNFYLIGRSKSLLITEGYNLFSLTATGRNNCGGIHCELRLKKRQDLFNVVWNFFAPTQDILDITIPLPDDSTPFIFALIPTSARSEFTQNHAKELEFLKKKSVPELGSKYECYYENSELLSTVLGDDILALLSHFTHLLESIYISDLCPIYVNEKRILHLQFRIPKNMQELDPMMKFVFFFTDKIATLKLSKIASGAIKKNRQRLEEERDKEAHALRQERAKAAKEKKTQELLEKLSPEEQEKLKEKEQKRKLRKQQSKQSKRVIIG